MKKEKIKKGIFNQKQSLTVPIRYRMVGEAKDYLSVHPIDSEILECLKKIDVLIYGGYVRDLIAKKYNPNFQSGFKDIDIIALPNSHNILRTRLEVIGYKREQINYAPLELKAYNHWGSVKHIFTMVKGNQKIQIASPRPIMGDDPVNIKNILLEPAKGVDIRCCAVAITSNMKLIELLPGAYDDCKKMELRESSMASHKINLNQRIQKLTARGWNRAKS